MKQKLQKLQTQAIDGLVNIHSESELIDYKNTILGKK